MRATVRGGRRKRERKGEGEGGSGRLLLLFLYCSTVQQQAEFISGPHTYELPHRERRCLSISPCHIIPTPGQPVPALAIIITPGAGRRSQ